MRKMFTRLFGLALLLLLFSAVSVVKAQVVPSTPCGPDISRDDVRLVTDLSTVCDSSDLITFEVVGYPGATFAYNYDGSGSFISEDSTFSLKEGESVRIQVVLNDTCYSELLVFESNLVDSIEILEPHVESPLCGAAMGSVTILFDGGYVSDFGAPAGAYKYLIVPEADWTGTGPSATFNTAPYISLSPNIARPPGTYFVAVVDNKTTPCLVNLDNIAAWDTAVIAPTSPIVSIDTIYNDTIDCYGGVADITVVVSGGSGDTLLVELRDYDTDALVEANANVTNDTAVFSAISAGTYYAVVIDSVGCDDLSEEFDLDEPEKVMFDIEVRDVTCADTVDGEIVVTVTNYVPGVVYEAKVESKDSVYAWVSSVADSIVISGLDPVYYSLYVRDSTNGCDSVGYINPNEPGNKNTISVQSPGEIMYQVVYDSIECYGDSVYVTIDSVKGGNGSGIVFQFYDEDDAGAALTGWVAADTTALLLPAGNYSIVGKNSDEEGCDVSKLFTVVQAPMFDFDDAPVTISPTCPGGNDGLVIINVQGGSGNYMYAIKDTTDWFPRKTFTSAAGTFDVYAKDLNCNNVIETSVTVVALDENLLFLSPVALDTANACRGNNVNNFIIIKNDAEWASQTGEVRDVEVFATMHADSVYLSGIAPTSTGTLFGDDSYTFQNLDAGTWYIWGQDELGCTSDTVLTINIVEPDSLIVYAEVTEHATCNNDNDGIITIKGEGGYGSDYYMYGIAHTYAAALNMDPDAMDTWPAGDTVVEINAGAGDWFVVLYDEYEGEYCNSRVISQKMTVESFDPVVAGSVISVTDIVCPGDSAGVIKINSATGGSGDLVYTLYVNGTTDADTVAGYVEVTDTTFSNLKAGTYYVEVTDMGVGGCDGDWINDIDVDQPDLLSFEVDSIDISCFGASDGLAVLTVSGGNAGTPMFKIGALAWKPFDEYDDVEKEWVKEAVITEPGTYTVWVRDTLKCPAGSKTFTIVEPDPLMVDAVGTDDTTACGDLDDGMIEVTITGGKLDVSGYVIEVAGVDTVSIPMDSVHTFYNVAPGTYEVFVTETGVVNPCTMIDSVTIDAPDTISVEYTQENVACKDGETGKIMLDIAGGSGDYTVSISPSEGVVTDTLISELPAGKYVVTVEDTDHDAGWCSLTLDTIVIDEPAEYLELEATWIQDLTCVDSGMFSLQASGGVGEYKYYAALSQLPEHILLPDPESAEWQEDSIFKVTEWGTWIVWVMDENGCIVGGEENDQGQVVQEWRIPIAKPEVIVTVDLEDLAVDCNGDMTAMIVVEDTDVTIEVNEVGMSRGYSVAYTSLAGVELGVGDTLANLGADTVIVTVTDTLSGCSGVDTVVITEPMVLEAMLSESDGDFTCPDAVEGYIEVTIADSTAGTAPYTYQLWQNGSLKTDYQPVNTFLARIDNDYTVVVMDDNGCTDTTNTISIRQVDPIEFAIIRETTCASDSAASVEIEVTGEAGRMFQVQWTQVEDEGGSVVYSDTSAWYAAGIIELDQVFLFDNENIADKHYEVTVVDNMGCVSDTTYIVTYDDMTDDDVELTVVVGVENECSTDVTLSAAGGAGTYMYMVDGEVVAAGLQMLGGGEHVIYVEDKNGCWDTDTVTLAYPMSMDTTLSVYVGDTTQFVYGMLDTALVAEVAGVTEYTFYTNVDTACVAELNVTVDARVRTAPVLDTVSPTDTIEDNHPLLVLTFEGDVTFTGTGQLTITKVDSMDASVVIDLDASMFDGNTVTVTYDAAVSGGLDKNTTYYVMVDSAAVMGDGLVWGGIMDETTWTFTTGPDFATGVTPGVEVAAFKVYPNPFNDYIRIDNAEKLDRVILSNIAGQRILDIENPTYEIRTGNLVTGVYVVTLISNDEIVKSERIIKR